MLATQNSAGGSGEMVALANGGLQLNALNQNIALNTTGGTANLVIEPNTGGASNGEVICFYGFQNLSDERLKTNLQPLSATEAQELFDGVEARSYDRVDGAAQQTGFVAQEVYKSGPLGKSFCKLKTLADLQEPAEANREAREEEARALLKNGGAGGDRTPRAASTCGTPGSSSK